MTHSLYKLFLAIGPVVALSLSALLIMPDFSPAAATRKGQAEMRKRVPMTKDRSLSEKDLRKKPDVSAPAPHLPTKDLRKKPDVFAPAPHLPTKTKFNVSVGQIELKNEFGQTLPTTAGKIQVNSGQTFKVWFKIHNHPSSNPYPYLYADITVHSGFDGTGDLLLKDTEGPQYAVSVGLYKAPKWTSVKPIDYYHVTHPGGSYPIAALLRVKVYVNPGAASKWFDMDPSTNVGEVPIYLLN